MIHNPPRCLRRLFPVLVTACLSFGGTAVSQDTQAPGASPFLRFRDRTLEYAGPESGESKPDREQPDEVGIGWFGPFDPFDPDDEHHAGMWWAASLAVEEANAKGGYRGRPFRLLPCWAEDPWGTGARHLARLVYEKHPWAILGSVDGPGTHLAEQIVAKARLSLVSPVSTDISVNLAGVPWMFSCAPGDDQLAGVIAGHVVADYPDPEDRCVVFSATDHDSRMATRQILKAFGKRNRSPHHRFDFDPGKPDLQVQLDALKKVEPEVVILSAQPDDAARVLKAFRQSHIKSVVFGAAPLGRRQFLRLAGPAAEGVRIPLLFPPPQPDARTRQFVRAFKARFDAEPDYAEVFTYDAATLLLEAINSTSLNRAHIRQALAETSPWRGIGGPITWDGTGQNTRAVTRMGMISNGKIKVLDIGE